MCKLNSSNLKGEVLPKPVEAFEDVPKKLVELGAVLDPNKPPLVIFQISKEMRTNECVFINAVPVTAPKGEAVAVLVAGKRED